MELDLERIEWPQLSVGEALERCPVCGEPTKFRKMVTTAGQSREISASAVCKCKRDKDAEQKAADALKLHEIELRQHWEKVSFAMTTFRRDTFATDDGGSKAVSDACKRYVEHWEEMRKDGMGVLFYGSVGTGKTFLAHAVANALIARGVGVIVTNFSRILNSLQVSKDRQQMLDELDKFPLLVIDDLGAERSSEFAREMVYSVIDQRGQANLPLIVTTNLSLEEMKNAQDMQLRRIYDRLLDLCPVAFRMDGVSRRTKNSEARKQKARNLLLG